MKTIIYTVTAMTALRRHANKAKLIRAKIEQFAANPASQARNVKALVGIEQSRLRVQDFRILFTETAETITVHDIGRAAGFTTKERIDMPVMTKGPQGDDIVILSRKEYDQLIAATNEDAADAEILRRSIARVKSGEEETFTSAEVDAFLAAKTPLAFFRKKRGISQDTLAKQAGITQGYLSEIEIGRKSGDVQTLRKIADVLKVSLDALVVSDVSIETPPKRKATR
jgi:DNA-binding XRE family transcriptional regulator/PHD/YefM family antitoxin component YafN of YafNO toxin-antitoxin module